MSCPSWLDCRNTSSRSSLSASDWHIFSTSASEVLPYTSGLRVPRRFRLGPLSTSTVVMGNSPGGARTGGRADGSSARPRRTGVRSDGGFLADALVLLARHLGRVLV